MIIIFTHKGNWRSYAYILQQNINIKQESIILSKFNKKYFDEALVIIPLGINSQVKLNKYPEYKSKFLINDKYTYKILDDKIKFYRFIKMHDLLKNSEIKMINTYDKSYDGLDKKGIFIVKHRNGLGSSCNKIIRGNLRNLIKKYGKNCQIQDVLNINRINGVNCLCKDGEIISGLNFVTPGFIKNSYYSDNQEEYFEPMNPEHVKIMSRIVKKLNYNGFIEFEFLDDLKGDTYLLEANPRISGNILCIMEGGTIPFMTNLVDPYCCIIKNKIVKTLDYGEKCSITYHGKFKSPKSHVHKSGVMTFSEN